MRSPGAKSFAAKSPKPPMGLGLTSTNDSVYIVRLTCGERFSSTSRALRSRESFFRSTETVSSSPRWSLKGTYSDAWSVRPVSVVQVTEGFGRPLEFRQCSVDFRRVYVLPPVDPAGHRRGDEKGRTPPENRRSFRRSVQWFSGGVQVNPPQSDRLHHIPSLSRTKAPVSDRSTAILKFLSKPPDSVAIP
jgi:hypothetical protein